MIHDSWGRCAVVFPRTDGWAPGVGVGFYYDAKDHKVPFVNPGNGVNLYLRVQAWNQTNPSPSKVLSALREVVPLLQQLGLTVRLKGDPENGNSQTLLIGRKSLTDVISGGELLLD